MSSDIPYRIEPAENYSILSLLPGLNDAQWTEIDNVGTTLLTEFRAITNATVLVDLSELSYMGSATVALIIRIWKSVSERNGKLVVVTQHEMVHEVLTLAGLDKLWTIVDTRAEGLVELGVVTSHVSSGKNRLLAGLGVLAMLGAGAGLDLLLRPIDQVSPSAALTLEVSCTIIGCLAGVITTLTGRGACRIIGVIVSLGCIGIGIAGASLNFG